MYINDLSYNLASNPKLFADDTSFFSVVKNVDSFTINSNSDLVTIPGWAFQWKINFNSDATKQAQEILYS